MINYCTCLVQKAVLPRLLWHVLLEIESTSAGVQCLVNDEVQAALEGLGNGVVEQLEDFPITKNWFYAYLFHCCGSKYIEFGSGSRREFFYKKNRKKARKLLITAINSIF